MSAVRLADSDVPEAFVAWLWEARRLGAVLTTLEGRRVQVIYPGRHWGSWGPDFRGALLALEGAVLRGDVEVHRRPSDWVAHGHSRDPAYAGVVLHVVWAVPTAVGASEPGFPPRVTRPAGRTALTEQAGRPPRRGDTKSLARMAQGPALPTVALSQHLQEPLSALLSEWQARRGRPVEFPACQPAPEAAMLLDAAGRARLEAKAARFEGDLNRVPPLEGLLAGILETLGYSANVVPFRRLVERFPLGQALAIGAVEGEDYLTAILFGASGLIGRAGDSDSDEYPQHIEQLWRESGRSGPPAPLGWRWVGVRPANAPARRLAAAAALLAAPQTSQLADRAVQAVLELPPRRVSAALRRLLIRPGHPYWRAHSDFGRSLPRPGVVLGAQRAADAVVNVVLPWALALGRHSDNQMLVEAAAAAYAAHPRLAENQITRHMAQQLIGPSAGRVIRGAARQQGLIHLYQHWCDARACGACPAQPVGGRGPRPFSAPSLQSAPSLDPVIVGRASRQ